MDRRAWDSRSRETPDEQIRAETSRVLSSLRKLGVLLKQDKRLPNVVTLVTGERLSSSWWSHPKGRLIFRVLDELSGHPDVLVVKLIGGKDTFVHRKLWPALLTVVSSREPWQRRSLSSTARAMLRAIDAREKPLLARGAAVKELTERLLVHGVAVHTESGRHETAVESWPAWARSARISAGRPASAARAALERACDAIGARRGALPWTAVARPRSRATARMPAAKSQARSGR